jgi:hypothetical protein
MTKEQKATITDSLQQLEYDVDELSNKMTRYVDQIKDSIETMRDEINAIEISEENE